MKICKFLSLFQFDFDFIFKTCLLGVKATGFYLKRKQNTNLVEIVTFCQIHLRMRFSLKCNIFFLVVHVARYHKGVSLIKLNSLVS